jgi:alkylated DNA repair dioxygenase AlkB
VQVEAYQKGAKPVPVVLEPRSLYVMEGAARWNYVHSISPVKELRYSITFRTLRKQGEGKSRGAGS